LKFCMKLDEYVADVRGGRWQKSRSFHLLIHPTLELAGKTLGVIGFGAIGRRVAEIGLAFHMRVLAYDIRDIHDEKTVQSTLEDVLTGSDIVSIHSPLTDQTRHLIGAAELGRMKRSAILINTARGGIVDESALADALNGGVIAGACVDTLSIEPPRRGNPLLGDVKNLYVTPHVAWTTRESRQRLMNGVAGNIERYLQGDLSGFIA
jgi:glycerate dehydrogenase